MHWVTNSPSNCESCHSRKESELTLRVSRRLNHTVSASFLFFLLQPDREQEQKHPPLRLHPPQILHCRVTCSFCHLSLKCVYMCVCVCLLWKIISVMKRTTSEAQMLPCKYELSAHIYVYPVKSVRNKSTVFRFCLQHRVVDCD